ncbi:7-carboxy-7-deazaguanine synthase [uncultured Synechococcales cyanobacterium]|uniref:7-carboxy-7-deazaguanine synthase n=1 Tax=uncultured Synechococcales cyanobacterium TaxID=1936017 RepID=A0A6J4VJZ9_9CYAN|nr:7-carboxy-7-deazaguanine synthase [uncultured Synechococcales cyanobacterium]
MTQPAASSKRLGNTPECTAQLVEVFSAIQGEGINVGTRQIFIRFGACDLRCSFCDSAHTWVTPTSCQIERSPGLRDFETHPNPIPLPTLLSWVEQQNYPGLHDSISLTGGEPLLHAPFLVNFLPQVRQRTGLPIYLETGGHRPKQLSMILPYLDIIGMDVKLPSVSGEVLWQAHREFLEHAITAPVELFVKIIISQQTELADLVKAAKMVAATNPQIPVILQPVTPLDCSGALLAPTPEQVLTWQTLMKHSLKSVRVIPQTHKAIGQI